MIQLEQSSSSLTNGRLHGAHSRLHKICLQKSGCDTIVQPSTHREQQSGVFCTECGQNSRLENTRNQTMG